MSFLKIVNDDSQFQALAAECLVSKKLNVLYFTASWCGPCRAVAPKVVELSSTHRTTTNILKIDLDGCKETARAFGVSSVPTFIFMRSSQVLEKFSGADGNRLSDTIVRLSQASVGGATLGTGEALLYPQGQSDLSELISKHGVECLNQSSSHTVASLFDENDLYLESDADEQLMISVEFTQPVKLFGMNFQCQSKAHGPKIVKLFINQKTPEFDECDDLTPTQTLELTPEDLKNNTFTKLLYVKFQNVNKITLFVESNQSGKDTTIINHLKFIGQPTAATDMKQFKRVSGEAGERHG